MFLGRFETRRFPIPERFVASRLDQCLTWSSNIWFRKDRAGRPASGWAAVESSNGCFLRFCVAMDCMAVFPRDKEAASKRMKDAWEIYRREAADPIAMAEAKKFIFVVSCVLCSQEVGRAATTARPLGGKSFGVPLCRQQHAQHRCGSPSGSGRFDGAFVWPPLP